MVKNYRTRDPVTSKLAGRHAEEVGLSQQQRLLCLSFVRAFPGHTAREIEARIGVKAHKRLPELREEALVRNGKSHRVCRISRRLAMTWYPTFEDSFNSQTLF